MIRRRLSTSAAATPSTPTFHSNVWRNSQGIIGEYAAKPVNLVTLNYLLALKNGKYLMILLDGLYLRKTDVSVAAIYAHKELPIRIARRVRGIQL